MSETIIAATEAALFLCQVAFHPGDPELSTPTPTGVTSPPSGTGAGAAIAYHTLTKTAATERATPMEIYSGKNNSNQQKLLPQHHDLPPTPKGTSQQRPVLERATATHIMLSRTKIRPQAHPTRRTLQSASADLSRCKRSLQLCLGSFPNKGSSSPITMRSTLRSSPTMRPS